MPFLQRFDAWSDAAMKWACDRIFAIGIVLVGGAVVAGALWMWA